MTYFWGRCSCIWPLFEQRPSKSVHKVRSAQGAPGSSEAKGCKSRVRRGSIVLNTACTRYNTLLAISELSKTAPQLLLYRLQKVPHLTLNSLGNSQNSRPCNNKLNDSRCGRLPSCQRMTLTLSQVLSNSENDDHGLFLI